MCVRVRAAVCNLVRRSSGTALLFLDGGAALEAASGSRLGSARTHTRPRRVPTGGEAEPGRGIAGVRVRR